MQWRFRRGWWGVRGALVRSGRDRLTGAIEVGDTYVGGAKPALRGGRYGLIGRGENPGGLLPAVLGRVLGQAVTAPSTTGPGQYGLRRNGDRPKLVTPER